MPPRKRYFDQTSNAPVTPVPSHEDEQKKSLWQRIGGLPGAAGAATRGISGLFSVGGPEGAATAGLGEAAAQWLESFSDLPQPTPAQRAARVAVESGIGYLPFGQWVRKGEALGNFLRGAAFSGGGDIARQMAEKGTLDPRQVDVGRAMGASTIGGTSSAGFQKIMDLLHGRSASKAAEEAAKAATAVSETTVKPPTKVVAGRPVSTGKVAPAAPQVKSATPSSKLADDFLTLLEGERPGVFKRTPPPEPPKAPRSEFPVPKKIETRHTIGAPPQQTEDFVADFQKELSKNIDKRVGAASKEAQAKTQFESDQYIKQLDQERALEEEFQLADAKRNAAYLDEKAAAERIAKEREGLVESNKTVTETSTQDIPGGRVTLTKKFGPPAEEITEEALDELVPPGSPARNVYDSWRAGGLSHEKALEKAARGDVPRGGIKLGKTNPPPEAPPPAAPTPAPTPTPQGPPPSPTSAVVPPGTSSPGRLGPDIETIQEGIGNSRAQLMKRLAEIPGDSPEAAKIVKKIKALDKQQSTAEEIAATVPPVGPPDIPLTPQDKERRFLAEWLARDLEDMPFQRGGTTPQQRADAFENWRPGDPESAKLGIGEGSARVAGTPTQEMFHAAGITGSRGDIAARIRKMLETGTIDPKVEQMLEDLRNSWNPETGKFDATGNLRSPVTLPPEGEFFDKYMSRVSDSTDTGEGPLDELMNFFGAQATNEGRRANIKDALRTGEDRVLQNKEIERFLTPRSDRGSILPQKAGVDPVPVPAAPTVVPEAPAPTSAIARFFKNRVDAMGNAYRAAKETPPAKGATESYKAAKRLLGKGLQDEAKAAGLPTGGRGLPPTPPPPREPQPFEPGWPTEAQIREQVGQPPLIEPEDTELFSPLRFFKNRGEAEAADTSWIKKELESLQDPSTLSAAQQAQIDPITAPVHTAREQEIADLIEENRRMQEELAIRQRLENAALPKGPAETTPARAPKVAPEPPASAIGGTPGTPRLVKPDGGTVIRRIKGGDETGMFRPEVALPMLSTGLGALSGAAYGDEEYDSPFTGAVLGGLAGAGLGFGGANMGKLASKGAGAIGDIAQGVRESLGNREDIAEGITQAVEKFPNLQRANLLTGFNLPVNAAVGPWGSVFFGGLENAVSNKLAGGTDTRGTQVLSEAMNPVNFLKKMYENRDEAARLVAQGELGRSEGVSLNPGGNALEQYMALPAVAMTAGDVTARNMLTKAGFPEDAARQITLTNEPVGAVGKAIANFGRGAVNETTPRGNRIGKALLNSMLPFRRTPGNIVDQGWERLPGFGLGVHALEPGAIDWNKALAQQAVSVPLAAASYGLGANLDPETARWVRRVISNAAGQYSMPASLAFTAGQAVNRGLSNDQSILRMANDTFPLPTTEGVTDLARFLTNTFQGEPAEIPRTMQPTILRDLFAQPAEQVPSKVGGLPQLSEYRRRRGR